MQKSVSLFYSSGSSNKAYHVQMVALGEVFLVNFQYGRKGGSLTYGTKTKDPVSLEVANNIFDKLVSSKTSKGYELEADDTKSDPEVAFRGNKEKSGILPQLLVEIKCDKKLTKLICDDSYIIQEKMDGERRLVKNSKEECIGINKKGFTVPLPKSIVTSMPQDCTLDGEIIGETLYSWDILSLNQVCLKSVPYSERLEILNDLTLGENIIIVKSVSGTMSKLDFHDQVKKDNKEGVVFKKISHSYNEGRNGGDALKFKFYKTATVKVSSHTTGKRSVGLEMISNESLIPVGKVTIPVNREIPKVGDLVEVRYLYAYKGGSLYQPTYLGERLDQNEKDINLDQLIYKAEL